VNGREAARSSEWVQHFSNASCFDKSRDLSRRRWFSETTNVRLGGMLPTARSLAMMMSPWLSDRLCQTNKRSSADEAAQRMFGRTSSVVAPPTQLNTSQAASFKSTYICQLPTSLTWTRLTPRTVPPPDLEFHHDVQTAGEAGHSAATQLFISEPARPTCTARPAICLYQMLRFTETAVVVLVTNVLYNSVVNGLACPAH